MSRRRVRSATSSPPARDSVAGHAVVPTHRLLAAGVVLACVAFAWFLANSTPLVETGSLINAPDEAAHVGYVRAVAVGHRLPTRSDAEFRTYQWHQPPLYYAVAALAYPLGLPGLRAVSVFFGLVSLWALWATARRLFPKRPEAVLLATAAAALLPMRHAVYSSVGNDAAIECMFSLTFLACASALVSGVTTPRALILGLLLGAATLTKLSGLLLYPGVALCLLLARPAVPSFRARLARTAWPVVLGFAIAAPWFAMNVARHGQLAPIRAFHEEFANTSRASDWIGERPLKVDTLSGELRPGPTMDRRGYTALVANWTTRTFLGAYTPPSRAAIGAPVFLPISFYACYIGLAALGLVGLLISRSGSSSDVAHRTYWLMAGVTACLVLGSFAGFTWTYFQAQGRYLYPAISPLALAWGLGLASLIPDRYRRPAVAGVIALLLALASAFAFIYVAPAYAGR